MSAAILECHAEDCLRQAAGHLFTLTHDGALLTDCQPRIVAVNPSFTRITGYAEVDARGQNPRFLKSDRHPPEFYARIWQMLIADGHWRGEIWNRRKHGGA